MSEMHEMDEMLERSADLQITGEANIFSTNLSSETHRKMNVAAPMFVFSTLAVHLALLEIEPRSLTFQVNTTAHTGSIHNLLKPKMIS